MRTITLLLALIISTSISALCQTATTTEIPCQPIVRVEFIGNTLLSDEELAKIVTVKPGETPTRASIDESVVAIQNAYKEKGYLAGVSGDLLAGFADTGVLEFPIVEVKVAEVRIEGLRKTKEYAVRRELKLKQGDLYNVGALRRDAARLDSFNAFESIDASVEPAAQEGQVVVIWKLKERPKSGYVSFGGSYGPSTGLFGNVDLVKSNFRGLLQQVHLTTGIGTAGGGLSSQLTYIQPWIAEDTSLESSLFSVARFRFSDDLLNNGSIGQYFERHRGVRFTATKTLSSSESFALGTRYEDVTVDDLPIQDFTIPLTSASANVFALSGRYTNDRRDSILYPTTGYIERAFLDPGIAWPRHDGTDGFVRASGDYRRYYPLNHFVPNPTQETPKKRPKVLFGRLSGGASAGNLPFFEQYFLGGTQQGLRGYRNARFWGKYYVLATTEYRQPLGKELTALAFVDVGDAWGSRYQFKPGTPTDFFQHEGFSPRAGIGLGIRYITNKFGSLGADIAWGEGFFGYLQIGEAF